MLIREIRIINARDNKVLRTIPFHLGANFVVDLELSARHNKVGKTTFLKLIDVLMGAKDRSLIYKDKDTNSTNSALKKFIEDNRVAAEMFLASDLEDNSKSDIRLRVDLFPHGSQYIDEDKYTADNYRRELNIILYGNEQNTPTFRQLIQSFVRVSVGGDNDAFLHNIERASTAVYRSVYNYLFDIADPALDKKLGDLNAEKNRLLESIKQYKRLNNVDDVEAQRQIAAALRRDQQRFKTAMDDIVDSDEYIGNRERIASIRSEYSSLMEMLNNLNYRIERNEEALELAKEESSRRIDSSLIRSFYEEVCPMLPEVNRTFEEVVDFNQRISDNKVQYFGAIQKDLLSEKASLKAAIDSFVKENIQFMSLISSDRVGEYEALSEKLLEVQQHIGQTEEIVDTLEKFAGDLNRIEEAIIHCSEEIAQNEKESSVYQERMDSFNSFFTPFAEKINGERPILIYLPDPNRFPVSITEINGSSTGTRKSLLAAYDLAYQHFAIENNLDTPRFVVHDIVENIEGDSLKNIVKIASQSKSQYIVAVLKEKLDSSGFSDEEQNRYQILQLAANDKLFEGTDA